MQEVCQLRQPVEDTTPTMDVPLVYPLREDVEDWPVILFIWPTSPILTSGSGSVKPLSLSVRRRISVWLGLCWAGTAKPPDLQIAPSLQDVHVNGHVSHYILASSSSTHFVMGYLDVLAHYYCSLCSTGLDGVSNPSLLSDNNVATSSLNRLSSCSLCESQ